MSIDTFLLLYIGSFLLLKAILVRRASWLGRSLCFCNTMLGIIFLYGAAKSHWPALASSPALNACRIGVAVGVTWASFELARVARDRWTLLT